MARPSAAGEQPRLPPPPSLYRSADGEAAITALYSKVLAALPFKYETRLVHPSGWGSAHVVVCGPADAPPLLLWHGMGAPAPYILDMFKQLVPHFRTYVPDLPYQAGSRTEPAILHPATHDHGRWCLEVLQALGLVPHEQDSGGGGTCPSPALGTAREQRERGQGAPKPAPYHVGASFGAAVLLDLAQVAPHAIRRVALVVPGGLMPVALPRFLLWVMLPSFLYMLWPREWTLKWALSGMVDDPSPEDWALIPLTWRHVARRPAIPGGDKGFTRQQLARLAAPTLICAERDCFWPGADAAAVAAAALPNCRTVLMEGAHHLPSKQLTEQMNDWVLEFFQDHADLGNGVAGLY